MRIGSAVRLLLSHARSQLAANGAITFPDLRLDADTPEGAALRATAERAARSMAVRVTYEPPPRSPDLDGEFHRSDRTIYVNPDRSPDDQALALAHELSHAHADWAGQASDGSVLDNHREEISAEVSAHALAAAHGLDTTSASAPYVFRHAYESTPAAWHDPATAALRPTPAFERLANVTQFVSAGEDQGVQWAREILELVRNES